MCVHHMPTDPFEEVLPERLFGGQKVKIPLGHSNHLRFAGHIHAHKCSQRQRRTVMARGRLMLSATTAWKNFAGTAKRCVC